VAHDIAGATAAPDEPIPKVASRRPDNRAYNYFPHLLPQFSHQFDQGWPLSNLLH